MPQSAIATGMVDLILPLEQIPEHILRFTQTTPLISLPMEEPETSKEELQSTNEGLSGDLHNLLKATDIAILYLDWQLRILHFTPRLGELFNMRMVNRGRPFSDITHRLGYDELQRDAQQVLDTLVPVEREVNDEAVKPLESYRNEELRQMKENFFGGDASYHIARFHFVHKISCHLQPAKEAREKYAVN